MKASFYQKQLLLSTAIVLISVYCSFAQKLNVPYVPTHRKVVDEMLNLANVGPGDFLIDLGSGDGRIVIAAAKRGAYAIGVDLDPDRIKEANINAQEQGVIDKVMFFEQNIFNVDISKATVVTMYLLQSVNIQLKPKLFEQLRPGTRIVSHAFDMGTWEPDIERIVEYVYLDIFSKDRVVNQSELDEVDLDKYAESYKTTANVYFWKIPANVKGIWEWQSGGADLKMEIEQQFQKISIKLTANGELLQVTNPRIDGERISFTVFDDQTKTQYVYSGCVEGNTIDGSYLVRSKAQNIMQLWAAKRIVKQ